jgi:hypothetical protein
MKVANALRLEYFTDSIFYILLPFFIYPFVSRQRFFYFLTAICCMQFIKGLLKLTFRAPRPLWIWPDLQCYSKDASFATPSGHVIDASFFMAMAILDTFFPSNYARRRYPSCNAF